MQNQTISSAASVALTIHKADTPNDVVDSAGETKSFQNLLTGQMESQHLSQNPSRKNITKQHLSTPSSAKGELTELILAAKQKNNLHSAKKSAEKGVGEGELTSNDIISLTPLKAIENKVQAIVASDKDTDIKKEADSYPLPNLVLEQPAISLLPHIANKGDMQFVETQVEASKGPVVSTGSSAKLYDLLKTSAIPDKNVNVEPAVPLSSIADNNPVLGPQIEVAKPQSTMPNIVMSTQVLERNVEFVNKKPSVEKENLDLSALAMAAQASSVKPTEQLASSNMISAYPGKSGWDQAISQKIVWMLGSDAQSVSLTLNPPDMGPLQVVLHVRNEQAEATFTSDNALVRQALADGMENLREKMQEAGIQLGQTNINSGHQSQTGFQQMPTNQRSELSIAPVVDGMPLMSSSPLIRTAVGFVDTFA